MPTTRKRKKHKTAPKKKASFVKRRREKKKEFVFHLYKKTSKNTTIERILRKLEDDNPPKTGKYPGPRLR